MHGKNAERSLAGPAGASLASRLSRSAAHPSILLIEAGGPNDSKSITIDAERWLHRFNPDQNWGYKTVPQEHLNGSVVSYDRGKGLGGSTSINFCKRIVACDLTVALTAKKVSGLGVLKTILRRLHNWWETKIGVGTMRASG